MRDNHDPGPNDGDTGVHATAVVHPGATIGAGVRIGPCSVIGEHVTIAGGCVIGPHVLIEGHTTIGQDNVFHHGVAIGTPPQDLGYRGETTYVEIGDGNTFREFVTVNRGSKEGSVTRIGSRCFLMSYTHVAHDCVIGDEVILANSVHLGGHVKVGDYANIGGVTGVHQFASVGMHAFIGGGSRVERDIPPFVKAAGSPTRVYGANSVGLRRRGYASPKRAMVKKMVHLLYRADLNVSQVVEHLKNGNEFEDPERTILVEFLEATVRGITK